MGDFAGVPFIAAHGYGGARPTTQVVVIHATDNTASAYNEASYCSQRTDDVSAHLFVDGSSAYQCVPIGNIAWCALYNGNRIGVHVELCGRSNAVSDATMRKAAPLVAAVCARYGIPVRKVSAAQVAAGAKGICGHADITKAFPGDGGDHTDPGSSFPWATFIGYVSGSSGGSSDVDVETARAICALATGTTDAGFVPAGGPDWLGAAAPYNLRAVMAKLAAQDEADRTRDAATLAAIQALTAGAGGDIDAAPIVAAIQEAAEQARAQESATVASLHEEIDGLRHALADALGKASADLAG